MQQICCNFESEVVVKEKLLNLPQNLTVLVFLFRFIYKE